MKRIQNTRRQEERQQRALNIHKRNMNISYHSGNCNSTANSNLAQNKMLYELNQEVQPIKVNQAQFYAYFKDNKVGGTPAASAKRPWGHQITWFDEDPLSPTNIKVKK